MNSILQQFNVERPAGVKREGKAALIVKSVPRDQLIKLFESPDEHEEPGECALVSAELSPDVPPQGTVLAEVLGWVGDITRHNGPVVGRHADPSSHSYRIRGSRIP